MFLPMGNSPEIVPTGKTKNVAKLDRVKRLQRRANSDTIVVPAKEEGFETEFLNNSQWYAIRIGAAMKDRIKYIAAYQGAPISVVTYIAEVHEIKPYKDTGKYLVLFKGNAQKLTNPILVKDSTNAPQGPVYVKREKLIESKSLEDALEV